MYNQNHHTSPIKGKRRFFFLLFPLMFFAMAGIVMLLWNATLPHIIAGVSALNFWQALGLLVLCRILFGGMHFGKRDGGPRFGPGNRQQLRQRWMEMNDEERKRFKEQLRQRCHHRGRNMQDTDNVD